MPECSNTPLLKKLGLQPGCRALILHQPENVFANMSIAEFLSPPTTGDELLDVVIIFVKEVEQLSKEFPTLKKRLKKAGGLWIAYPKKSSKVTTDLTEASVRQMGLDGGLVDNKVCSIDTVWTGVRFVYRKADR